MSKTNLFVSIIAVSFFGAAFLPDLFGGIVPTEYTSYCFLAVCSVLMFVVLLFRDHPIIYNRHIAYSLLFVLLTILYFAYHKSPWINYAKCLSFFCLFVSLCQLNKEERNILSVSFPIISSIFSILILFSNLHNHSTLPFASNLWYDNSAGPLLVVSIGVVFLLPLLSDSRIKMQILATILLLIHFSAAITTSSRTSLISMIIVCLIYCSMFSPKHNRKFSTLTLSSLLVVAIVIFCLLMFKKSDSSDGRLLIWRIAIDASIKKPLFGHGPGSFISDYMSYQANFFLNNTDNHLATIAGNVYHPFNEFILIYFQYGIIGLFVLITIIIFLAYNTRKDSSTLLCIIVLITYSSFSYPSKYTFFWVTIMYICSGIGQFNRNEMAAINKLQKYIIGFGVVVSLLCITVADISFNVCWKRCYDGYENNDKESLNNYKRLSRFWNHDPAFLYNWALLNYQSHNYKSSLTILEECSRHLNDYNVEMLYGCCLEQMKLYNRAVLHYSSCKNMWPSMFMPDYKLFEIYRNMGDSDNAVVFAKVLVEKIPKMDNSIYELMKNNAKDYLEKNNQ